MTTRRNFLGGIAGILAGGIAPAIGHAGILMPVRKIVVPEPVLSMAMLDRLAAQMASQPIEPYIAIVHPEWLSEIRNTLGFVTVEKYAAMKPMPGEVGCFGVDGVPYTRIISQLEIYK